MVERQFLPLISWQPGAYCSPKYASRPYAKIILLEEAQQIAGHTVGLGQHGDAGLD